MEIIVEDNFANIEKTFLTYNKYDSLLGVLMFSKAI
jgi:hypothetical protein